jgi:hypothetical protein
MRFRLFFLLFLSGFSGTSAQVVCHFNRVDIPRNDARLLELARVVEFRCEYVLPMLEDDSQFIAERYQNGKCVSRHCFSLGVYSSSADGFYKGVISFGWHMDDYKLVGINDTGYFHLSGFAMMAGFVATENGAWSFFKDSLPEARISKSGLHFDLYPVFALRSSKERTFKGVTLAGLTGTAASPPTQENVVKSYANAPDAIIVYLSFGTGRPDLEYDK